MIFFCTPADKSPLSEFHFLIEFRYKHVISFVVVCFLPEDIYLVHEIELKDDYNGMWVKEFKEYEYILWIDKAGKATWVWYLIPSGNDSTRLITKLRTKYVWTNLWVIYYLFYDIGDIVMMSKCMKGIKLRAEAHARPGTFSTYLN